MPTRSLLCVSAIFVAVTCAVASISTSPATARLKVINPPDAPASLSKVTIQNDSGREISFVHYELQNKGKDAVKGVFLKVIFFNQSGKVTGGEVFLEHMNVKSHHHAIFQTALGQYAGEDIATVGIAIAAVNSVNNHWKDMTPTNQLVDQMKE